MVAVQADEKGRTGIFLGNPAGDDSHDSLMPAFVRQDDGLRGLSGGEHGYRLPVNFRFHRLPLPVQGAQGFGGIRCLLGVIGEKQLHSQIDLSHPARGVDAGSQHKADGGGGNGFGVAAALGHESGNAGALGVRQQLQPPGGKDPVLSPQGHHVRYGAQAHHVGVLRQHRLRVTAQGAGQLEGNAHAGKILVGIAAVGPVGVNHRDCLGQGVLAFVVVGNDQVHAQLLAQLSLGYGGNAAVHGDDELNPLVVELVQGDGVQTVAFFQAAGDVADTAASVAAEKVRQKAGGGNAVHVIVAEDRDFFLVFDGQRHSSGGQRHIRHQEGVGQGGAAIQIVLCLGTVLNAPGGQHHGGQWGVARAYQGVHRSHIRLLLIPNSVFHLSTHPVISIFLTL